MDLISFLNREEGLFRLGKCRWQERIGISNYRPFEMGSASLTPHFATLTPRFATLTPTGCLTKKRKNTSHQCY